jgi:hypothetical protein
VKVEVKNINYVWHAFFPSGTIIKSAGIGEIVDMVNDRWPKLEPGFTLEWEAKQNKFVVRAVENKKQKLSKTEKS